MERVRRLLAIANDPAASDNEQRIALEQAQRLMDNPQPAPLCSVSTNGSTGPGRQGSR